VVLNRQEAIKTMEMMWPKDIILTIEQYEAVVDIIECISEEYKHKTRVKVEAIESFYEHNNASMAKTEITGGSSTIKTGSEGKQI
jgi:hypothetical protein